MKLDNDILVLREGEDVPERFTAKAFESERLVRFLNRPVIVVSKDGEHYFQATLDSDGSPHVSKITLDDGTPVSSLRQAKQIAKRNFDKLCEQGTISAGWEARLFSFNCDG